MIYIYNYFNSNYFFLFSFFVYSFLLLIIILKKTIYYKLSLEEYKNSPELIISYLDKYYIKNKYITFTCFFFYIFIKISFILYIRYLYLGYEMHLTRFFAETNNLTFLLLIKLALFLFMLIIIIRLFYFLMSKIFFDELIKVYIFFYKNKLFSFIINNLLGFFIKDVWGPCYLFFDCIYRKTPRPDEFFYNEYYSYDYIYKYNLINIITEIMIILSKKYNFIFLFIKLCRKISHILYVHVNHENIIKYLPWFLLIIAFLFDFFYLNIYYTYYMLFICYFLSLYVNFYDFIHRFNPLLISRLHNYFYKNSIEYSKQRLFINDILIISSKTKEYTYLLYIINDSEIIEHIYYNFRGTKKQYDIKMRIMNLRFYTMMLLSILVIYLVYLIINNKIICNYHSFILVGVIMITWIITIFYGKYTYALEQEDPNDNKFPMYIYNKKYEIIFWLLIILQGYVFWKILFKPEITFMGTEILLQLPFDVFKVSKNYNIEEKILYLFQYFEYKLNSIEPENHDYLRHILRQIDFTTIENPVNIKDIEVYINLLLDNHEVLKIFVNKSIFHFDYLIQEIFEDLRNFINTDKFKAKQVTNSYLWEFIENNRDTIKNLWNEKNNISFVKTFIKQKFFDDLNDFMQEKKSRNTNMIVLLSYMLLLYASKTLSAPINNIDLGRILGVFFKYKVYLRDYKVESTVISLLYKITALILSLYNMSDNFFYIDSALLKEFLEYGYHNAHKVFYQPDFTLKSYIIDKNLLPNIKKFFIK